MADENARREHRSQESGRAGLSTLALWTLAVLGTVMFLRFSRELLIPIVIGALVAYAINPVVRWLEAHRLPRAVGSALILLVICGSLALGVYALKGDIERAAKQLPTALEQARTRVGQAMPQLAGSAGPLPQQQPPQDQPPQDQPPTPGQSQPQENGAPGDLGNVSQLPSDILGYVLRGSAGVLTLLGHVMVIVFLVYFLLTAAPTYRDRIIEVAGPSLSNERTAEQVIDDITQQIQRFLLVRAITGAIVGVATWLALLALGIEGAALWGFLAGVFNSIPYFGPIIVSGGLFVVGAVQQGDVTAGVRAAAVAMAITSLEGWVLEPPLMGKAERMSTLAVFLGLVLWSWIWGVWGTLLAVPMLVVVKSIADHIERLRPLSRLLASR